MSGPTKTGWQPRALLAGAAGALAVGALALAPSPAQAFWIGFPFPGYYPAPYYYYPPPYYYAPPPAAYYPPAYPADPAYAAPAQPAPSAYTPQPTASATTPTAPAAPGQTPQITYTNKPAFTNASGQTCREYTTQDTSGKAIAGTACKAADGQWRVVN